MVDDYVSEFESLSKGETQKEGLSSYGLKIGDIRKIIKRDKLQDNTELGKGLMHTNNYDLMQMGYIIMDTSDITFEDIKQFYELTDNLDLIENRLVVFVAENKDVDEIIDYYKTKDDLKSRILYYGSLSARLSMEPTYRPDLISEELNNIKNTIQSESNKILIKNMNDLVSTTVMQSSELRDEAFSTYDSYKDFFKKYSSSDIYKRYETAKKNNQLEVKRDSCRC